MKKDTYTIRPAEFRDAEAIFGLIRKHPRELLPRPISNIVQSIDRFLVCEVNGKVAGTISWQILPEIGAPREPSIEIQSLAVEKKHRKSGMGHALVHGAIDRIRPLHPSQIVVLTFFPDFFRKLGFREVSKKKLMHKIYMGCVNCTKYDSPFTCPEIAMGLDLKNRETESQP